MSVLVIFSVVIHKFVYQSFISLSGVGELSMGSLIGMLLLYLCSVFIPSSSRSISTNMMLTLGAATPGPRWAAFTG